MYVYLNGSIINNKEAKVSVEDRGFLLGDGLFETIRAYNGKPFLLKAHLQRLYSGLERLSITIRETEEELSGIVKRLLELNSLKDAYIRITVTRGLCSRGISTTDCTEPTVCIVVKGFNPPDERLYREGVQLCFVQRPNLRIPEDADIKSLSFLNYILARTEVERKGAFEGIMLNLSGHLTECTTSNIFFVKDGIFFTPAVETGILKGITRQTVISLLKQNGYSVVEGRFLSDDLLEADEVFITNSLIEILPVSGIEDRKFKTPANTLKLHSLYRELITTECF